MAAYQHAMAFSTSETCNSWETRKGNDLGAVFAVFGVLVVSIKRFFSTVIPGPDIRGTLHPPGDGSCYAS